MLEPLFSKTGWAWANKSARDRVSGSADPGKLSHPRSTWPLPAAKMFPNIGIFGQEPFLFVTIVAYFLEWGLFVPVTYLTSYCRDTGELSPTYSQFYVMCYTIVALGTLIGVPMLGPLLERMGGAYWGVTVFTGLCYFCVLLCFVAIRVAKVGWRRDSVY